MYVDEKKYATYPIKVKSIVWSCTLKNCARHLIHKGQRPNWCIQVLRILISRAPKNNTIIIVHFVYKLIILTCCIFN